MGTVIAWPLSTLPTGNEPGKWLECNGQAVNSSLYPKLASLMSYTPNYQGVFLRGYGSQYSYHYNTVLHSSSSLGVLQGDSIRNIAGDLGEMLHSDMFTGPFYERSRVGNKTFPDDRWVSGLSAFDASRVVPTANEDRPVNIAVKYLIKAK